MSGKKIRLNRLFKNSQPLFTVPMDHGVSAGPIAGLRDIRWITEQVARGGADAVIVHKGLAEIVAPALSAGKTELIIHLSASTSLAPDSNRKELVCSLEQAIRLGATAVSVHTNLASPSEAAMLKDLGRVADQCFSWGIPLLAMLYVRDGKKESEYDPAKIGHAARLAEELGADIIKVNYPGSPAEFREITQCIQVPVIIAGGPKMDTTLELLNMVSDAVQSGSRGVAIGRNVFQHPQPLLLSQAIRQILDQGICGPVLQNLADEIDSAPSR